jgi:hypothetical protein
MVSEPSLDAADEAPDGAVVPNRVLTSESSLCAVA